MATVLMDELVQTDYGQLDLVWTEGGGFDGDPDRFFDGQSNGLVGAADPNGVYVVLARRSGGSPVRMVLHYVEPDLPEADYDDIVEVSTTVPGTGSRSGRRGLERPGVTCRGSHPGRTGCGSAHADGTQAPTASSRRSRSTPTSSSCGPRPSRRTRSSWSPARTPPTGTRHGADVASAASDVPIQSET